MAQDEAKMSQDGAKTAQDEAKTTQDEAKWPKMKPRRPKMEPGWPKMWARRAQKKEESRTKRSLYTLTPDHPALLAPYYRIYHI